MWWLVRAACRSPSKRKQVHQPALDLERTAPDGVGVDAQLLAEADRGEAVGGRRKRGLQEAGLVQDRATVLVVAGKGLQCRSACQLGEGTGEGALRGEQVEASEHAADAIQD